MDGKEDDGKNFSVMPVRVENPKSRSPTLKISFPKWFAEKMGIQKGTMMMMELEKADEKRKLLRIRLMKVTDYKELYEGKK